jgi:hypothetical protein
MASSWPSTPSLQERRLAVLSLGPPWKAPCLGEQSQSVDVTTSLPWVPCVPIRGQGQS